MVSSTKGKRHGIDMSIDLFESLQIHDVGIREETEEKHIIRFAHPLRQIVEDVPCTCVGVVVHVGANGIIFAIVFPIVGLVIEMVSHSGPYDQYKEHYHRHIPAPVVSPVIDDHRCHEQRDQRS